MLGLLVCYCLDFLAGIFGVLYALLDSTNSERFFIWFYWIIMSISLIIPIFSWITFSSSSIYCDCLPCKICPLEVFRKRLPFSAVEVTVLLPGKEAEILCPARVLLLCCWEGVYCVMATPLPPILYLRLAFTEPPPDSMYPGKGGVDLLRNGLKLPLLPAMTRFILLSAAYCRFAKEDWRWLFSSTSMPPVPPTLYSSKSSVASSSRLIMCRLGSSMEVCCWCCTDAC